MHPLIDVSNESIPSDSVKLFHDGKDIDVRTVLDIIEALNK